MTRPEVIAATRCWVEKTVIGMNLCPFARPVVEAGRLRFAVSSADDVETALGHFADELARLDRDENIETTLFILPRVCAEFDNFLDLLALADALLADLGYEGVYQIASFHPDYQFEGTEADDPANYTNRSPYPMLHLLREDSLAKAIAAHPDPASIPGNNIKKTREAGEKMAYLLRSCL